jgi:hypothetical protein
MGVIPLTSTSVSDESPLDGLKKAVHLCLSLREEPVQWVRWDFHRMRIHSAVAMEICRRIMRPAVRTAMLPYGHMPSWRERT